jgi:hypothetical protein
VRIVKLRLQAIIALPLQMVEQYKNVTNEPLPIGLA